MKRILLLTASLIVIKAFSQDDFRPGYIMARPVRHCEPCDMGCWIFQQDDDAWRGNRIEQAKLNH